MALAGKIFALSATGEKQADLASLIRSHGGAVSRIVHRRCDFLVATPAALESNTQSVRKAVHKFSDTITMVLPAFVRDSISAGALCQPDDYIPKQPAVVSFQKAPSASTATAKARAPTLDQLGLHAGDRIEVLVEMTDDPVLQWWPVRVELLPSGHLPSQYAIIYEVLKTRGYDDETASRARFGFQLNTGDSPVDVEGVQGAEGRLYDLEEGVWRPWRKIVDSPIDERGAVVTELASEAAPDCACVYPLPRKEGARRPFLEHSKQKRLPMIFKRHSAARAFAVSARIASARRRLSGTLGV